MASFLPASIWADDWHPPNSDRVFTATKLYKQVFAAANLGNGNIVKLEIHARSSLLMAEILDTHLTKAAASGDYTDILSPEQEYQV
jgi:hypothetical protein